jgi:hypothetical protein
MIYKDPSKELQMLEDKPSGKVFRQATRFGKMFNLQNYVKDELEMTDMPVIRAGDNVPKDKLDRMRYRVNKKPWLFYPED